MTDTTEKDDLSFTLPSSKSDKEKIKNMLQVVTGEMQMIEDRRSSIKDTIAALHEEFKIPKKILTKLAKTMYKHDYSDVTHEIDVFQLCYEGIIVAKAP